jgi:hypothetical protein
LEGKNGNPRGKKSHGRWEEKISYQWTLKDKLLETTLHYIKANN